MRFAGGYAVPGATTAVMRDGVGPVDADVLVVMGGTNDVGTEVLAFTSFDELVDQARWCLDHLDDARQIGDRAAVRAHADHTFAQRATELLRVVGLDQRGTVDT